MTPEQVAERVLDDLITHLYLDSLRDEIHRGGSVGVIAAAIRQATEERQEFCAQVAAATAPHAGLNCGCGECAGANGAAEAIRSISTDGVPEPPTPSPPQSDEV